jgi:hypothetical protein
LKTVAEIHEEHIVKTPFGRQTFIRRTGAALHPQRESLETLKRIRATIGEYNFAGQYQQTPAPAGGGMVKEAWFSRFSPDERPASFDQIIQSWDTANKPSELADYSVCTTWGVKGPNFYLLNVLRKKLDFPDLKRAVRQQSDLFNPTVILIEDKASGSPRAHRVRSPHHRWDSGRCRGSPIHPTNLYRRDRRSVSETTASASSSF